MLQDIFSEKLKNSPVFIIDDEELNLRLIDRILKTNGFTQLTTIQDPFEVVELFKAKRPHLILLDINMPGIDGFGVLKQLQALAINLPPIVFLSAQNAHEYRTRAFESGVLDFISKPFNRIELLSRVRNLLSLENAHQQLEQRNLSLEKAVEARTADLKKTQLQVVQRLGRAAEFRDNETGSHLLKMSNISALIAKGFGFTEHKVENMLNASPMHDVGKIAIPDNILLKPGKLDPDEWEIMKTHTTLGYEILKGGDSELIELASEIALSHHEKWDGSGYPQGLSGEDIPISCRIVAVADVFDALISSRHYKEAWSLDKAQNYINAQSGKHFDPKIVQVFNRLFPQIMEIQNKYKDLDKELKPENNIQVLPTDDQTKQPSSYH